MDDLFERFRDFHPAFASTEPERHYQCEKCKDTGWICCQDERGYEYAKHCECWEVRQARKMFKESGITEEFLGKRFKNFETGTDPQLINAKNTAIKYVQSFLESEKLRFNSIMFSGQVGAGKTHLGIAICRQLMNKGVAVTYMPYRNAMTKIKQNVTDEEGYERELERYMLARVLFIDDLLKGRITEADTNVLYEIINHRYMNNMPLIISTEKTIEALLDYDEAIGSRIIEMCRGNIIQLVGQELNYRLR